MPDWFGRQRAAQTRMLKAATVADTLSYFAAWGDPCALERHDSLVREFGVHDANLMLLAGVHKARVANPGGVMTAVEVAQSRAWLAAHGFTEVLL